MNKSSYKECYNLNMYIYLYFKKIYLCSYGGFSYFSSHKNNMVYLAGDIQGSACETLQILAAKESPCNPSLQLNKMIYDCKMRILFNNKNSHFSLIKKNAVHECAFITNW